MGKFLVRFILMIVVIGFLGLLGFAYLGDMAPERSEQRLSVTLDLQ